MSSFQDVDIVLFRDSLSRPWGFRIQGGADFNFPLTIQRVFSGSPAEGELLRGDIILAFDGYDVGRLTHKQAQDVVRVAGNQLRIRVRRPVFGNPRPVVSSASVRPKSTSPHTDSNSSYFASNEAPKPSWQPARGPGLGDFGVQYGRKTPTHHSVQRTISTPSPLHVNSQSPYQDTEQALQRMEDSLTKLTLNNDKDDEVDYSFTKKSVSERKKLFQQEDRPRAASCQPLLRHHSHSSNFMSSSYSGPSMSSPHQSSVMSSSYTEPHRPAVQRTTSYGPSSLGKTASLPRRGINFGWSPSPEKLAAARRDPQVSSVSQIQHSVSTHHDNQSNDPWRSGQDGGWSSGGGGGGGGGYFSFQPLVRSTSVSVLHESPTRNTMMRNVDYATPRHPTGGQFREVGRWHMETHSQAGPVKKFSTSATIRVGARNDQKPTRVVRRFSASGSPFDGTMSLDRRHTEPLKITIGNTFNADYRPAYPANVPGPPVQSPSQRAAVQEIQHHISRAQSHQTQSAAPKRSAPRPSAVRAAQRSGSSAAPARSNAKPTAGTYRPLQQSYSTPTRWDEPDHMSSDF